MVSLVLEGMQAGVAAVIADVVIDLGAKITGEKNVVSLLIMAGAFLCAYAVSYTHLDVYKRQILYQVR